MSPLLTPNALDHRQNHLYPPAPPSRSEPALPVSSERGGGGGCAVGAMVRALKGDASAAGEAPALKTHMIEDTHDTLSALGSNATTSMSAAGECRCFAPCD